MSDSVAALFDGLKKRCPPGLWSKAVALARAGQVIEESRGEDEIHLRVHVKDRPLSPKVSLWTADEDCFCDCDAFGAADDLCIHVAAAVIAVKNDQVVQRGLLESPSAVGGGPAAVGSGATTAPYVRYRFERKPEGLALERVIVRGGREDPLDGTLVGYVGGISSGRIPGPTLAASKEDFVADAALSTRRRGLLERELLVGVLAALVDSPNVALDGATVRVGRPLKTVARVLDAGDGFAIECGARRPMAAAGAETGREDFRNGAALLDGVLHACPDAVPTELAGRKTYPARDGVRLVSEILPRLRGRIDVEIVTRRLPEVVEGARPNVVIKTERTGDGVLVAVASLVYGDPAVAEVVEGTLVLADPRRAPLRDEGMEWQLARKLQNELHLTAGRLTRLEGEAAARFADVSRGWTVVGGGARALAVRAPLVARFEVGEGGLLSVAFESGDLGRVGASHADWDGVWRAWQNGQAYAPLSDGGFAALPRDWLERFGPRLVPLLAARDAKGRVPACLLPEMARLCDDVGQAPPRDLQALKAAIETFDGIPEAELPADLTAELRTYQKKGVDWLRYLTGLGMGVLLADDMGLGKTLQALCLIDRAAASQTERALIVCPTSVVASWMSQIQKFRPKLQVMPYYGVGRSLPTGPGVVLTTYAILRLDREVLCAAEWDTIVLDEAQTIKNPDSQVAQAAHELSGRTRLALSGTPVENHLDDVWSQFRFLNPGLLGTRREFGDLFARNPAAVRTRLKPFILRRLKSEVAPELPPRIESVLHCELETRERDLYDALFAATRAEVIDELRPGGSVLRALELLLRLRQTCCDPRLVPGEAKTSGAGLPSSKIKLLVESLLTSIDNGHRALVFSQWTSFLDLIEPALAEAGVAWLRLDGTTRDRAGVVEAFQSAGGPPVMLLSLKAGGVGLTLTAADHVFLMDPWWNPAVEAQAADRAHRIGQTNTVFVQRLIARDTIEDRILGLQKKKLEIAGAVLHDAEGLIRSSELTREDLLELVRS